MIVAGIVPDIISGCPDLEPVGGLKLRTIGEKPDVVSGLDQLTSAVTLVCGEPHIHETAGYGTTAGLNLGEFKASPTSIRARTALGLFF